MYESYWKLKHKPFDHGADATIYYPAEPHQAALLKLRYAVENRRGAALLIGPSGSGKTMLVRLLAQQLGETFQPFAHVVYPQMAPHELLCYLSAELGAPPTDSASTSIDASVRRIERRLAENVAQGRHAVVVIDEAHLIEGNRTFEALRMLLNFENASGPFLTLLLVAQTSLVPILTRLPQLDERLAVKCMLRALTVEETMAYVQHRLAVAGSDRAIFEPSATEALHQLARGIPRQINRLCDLALLIAFAEEQSSITAEQISAVNRELVAIAVD